MLQVRPEAYVKDTIRAGDVAGPRGCLTDGELDTLLGPILSMPADTFFRIARGDITLASVKDRLSKGRVIAIV